jgi:adenosylcobinamide-phosphate synthase
LTLAVRQPHLARMLLARDPMLPLLLLLGAMLLDWLVGDPRWLWRFLPHPVVMLGWLIRVCDRSFNRLRFADRSRRRLGGLTVLLVVGVAALAGAAVRAFAEDNPQGWIAELLLVAVLLAQRDLFDHVQRVRRALVSGGVTAGREAVAAIVGRDSTRLDQFAVARAAIESLAENFSDGVVAPIFWYLLLGPAGMFAYKAINTADSMIAHKSAHYLQFGRAAAKLDDWANWIPARLACLFIVLAALVMPGAAPLAALRTAWRDARHHRSPNAGWPEAAMAGALDLALSGPRAYDGEILQEPWIGEGRARVLPRDIGRALGLFAIACLWVALPLVAAIGWLVR